MRYEDLWTECWGCGKPLDLTSKEVKSIIDEMGIPLESIDNTHALYSSNCPLCRKPGEAGDVQFRLMKINSRKTGTKDVEFQ